MYHVATTLRILVAGTLGVVALGATHAAPGPEDIPWRLDHANVVVRNLAAARADFERLGFAFKAGRIHRNSIDNAHMKFPDGTELELITASEPRDALARRYVELLRSGEGGAFFAMRADSVAGVLAALRRYDPSLKADTVGSYIDIDDPPGWNLPELFVMRYLTPPVDSAHHHAHPNGAYALRALWLKRDSADRADLSAFDLRPLAVNSAPLERPGVRAARFAGGSELYVLPAMPRDSGVTRIIGVTILVRDAARAAELLQQRVHQPFTVRHSPRGRLVLVPPELTHGIWLELLEAR